MLKRFSGESLFSFDCNASTLLRGGRDPVSNESYYDRDCFSGQFDR